VNRVVKLFSGEYVDPFDPDIDKVHIADIAHSLALQCRFNGHCDVFYSVAQHSMLVSDAVRHYGPMMAMYGLLHDASEMLLGDIVSPVKQAIPQLAEIENKVSARIFQRFSLPGTALPESVKAADRDVLAREASALLNCDDDELLTRFGLFPPAPGTPFPRPLSPADAFGEFLRTFDELAAEMRRTYHASV